eukprot:3679903-Prymnesium_polylepis.1
MAQLPVRRRCLRLRLDAVGLRGRWLDLSLLRPCALVVTVRLCGCRFYAGSAVAPPLAPLAATAFAALRSRCPRLRNVRSDADRPGGSSFLAGGIPAPPPSSARRSAASRRSRWMS